MQSPTARIASNSVITSGTALALFACFSVIVYLIRAMWVMESVAALS
jgi:hypothetical protein